MLVPKPLSSKDHVRIIAPSSSYGLISKENREIALSAFRDMGLEVSFGRHVEEMDPFFSSSIESRILDLHEAFEDPSVQGIFTVLGGHNANQLLASIDYERVRKNPKVLCGFSDITALQNALFAKTGLVTFSGPHFSTFAMKKGGDYTLKMFQKALFQAAPFEVPPSEKWSDDPEWFIDQETRTFHKNEGYWPMQAGEAKGTLVGGNLGTFILLKGTPYMPSLADAILFLEEEECGSDNPLIFDRKLQSLIDLPEFKGVQGIVIGRFQKGSGVTRGILDQILKSKAKLKGMPILANADFGHTTPMFSFPIGGTGEFVSSREGSLIRIGER